MNRRIGLIAVAVLLAIIGTGIVYSYAHNADKRAVDATRSANVVYAVKDIPAGTTWADVSKSDYLQVERVPVNSVPASAISGTDASIQANEVATHDIAAGEIVVRPSFGDKTSATGILAIPKGEMALSISVPSNADAAGFIQPGSQIALFHTFKVTPLAKSDSQTGMSAGDKDLHATKLLLPRVDVIATSQDAPSDLNGGKNGTSSGAVLVTLAVTQDEAEKVILAQAVGDLYMALLSDSSVTAPDGGQLTVVKFNPSPLYVK
jgi:pilus assembly protein CpaB